MKNISNKSQGGLCWGYKMLLYIIQTNSMLLRDAEKKRGESKIGMEPETQSMKVIPICLYHHPMGPSKHSHKYTHTHKHTHTSTYTHGHKHAQKSLKSNLLHPRGHCGDYPPPQMPVTQRCRDLMHAFLGRSHKFPSWEETELDEMLPKR